MIKFLIKVSLVCLALLLLTLVWSNIKKEKRKNDIFDKIHATKIEGCKDYALLTWQGETFQFPNPQGVTLHFDDQEAAKLEPCFHYDTSKSDGKQFREISEIVFRGDWDYYEIAKDVETKYSPPQLHIHNVKEPKIALKRYKDSFNVSEYTGTFEEALNNNKQIHYYYFEGEDELYLCPPINKSSFHCDVSFLWNNFFIEVRHTYGYNTVDRVRNLIPDVTNYLNHITKEK